MPHEPRYAHTPYTLRGMLLAPTAMLAWVGFTNPAQSSAQSSAAPPKFEVASVKPCKPGDLPPNNGGRAGGAGGVIPVGHELCAKRWNVSFSWLTFALRMAKHRPAGVPSVSARQVNQPIEGSPSWVKSETFTIDAKPESPQTMEMMRGPMLQALLEDRFKLKVHRETGQVPIYALVVAKGGPKLDAAKKDSCTPPPDFANGLPPPLRPNQPPPCGAFSPNRNGGTRTFGQTLAGLSAQFSVVLDRDVVDRTGIKGTFDIHLEASYEDLFEGFDNRSGAGDAPAEPNGTDPLDVIGSAVQKLGLRLESTNGPAIFIVIDHVEPPSQN